MKKYIDQTITVSSLMVCIILLIITYRHAEDSIGVVVDNCEERIEQLHIMLQGHYEDKCNAHIEKIYFRICEEQEMPVGGAFYFETIVRR